LSAEQLALISKYKSEFLANMSHELRTPLNSLLILSQMLAENKDSNLSPEQVKYANTIYSSGNDLLSLINEILDLAKVEAGKMPINPTTVDINQLRETMEQSFHPVAAHKGIGFRIQADPGVRRMFTDPNRLQQILKNLLSNAFKFTEKGEVTLIVKTPEAGRRFPLQGVNPQDAVCFAVRDTGVGIPKEKQKIIFEAFQQADGTTNRKYGGTGLGLTISRQIARLLGGVIEVESQPGQGSMFTLYLPLNYQEVSGAADQTSETPIRVAPLPKNADFSGKSILLVDDDKRNIFAIRTVLESRGMKVFDAENGLMGIKALQTNPNVDLVLMDTMMPEMDGLEATQTIRNLPQFRTLPIISLTAKAMKGDRDKCLAAGASDYVTKPVEPEKLLSILHMWLNRNVRVQ
jgi:CheY-like chemotaxis protein/nitrogen-specific signal transduction histidine kinase